MIEMAELYVGTPNGVQKLSGSSTQIMNFQTSSDRSYTYANSELPYAFYWGKSLLYRGEIHILGGGSTSDYKKHYKYNGVNWVEVSTLPYNFNYGQAVVYNDEIHIIGGYIQSDGGYKQCHYKWNGSKWTNVGGISFQVIYGASLVYNNKIHLFGCYDYKSHRVYDGSKWYNGVSLPYDFSSGGAVVYNNEMHLMYNGYHIKFDESSNSWVSCVSNPYEFSRGCCIVHDGKIHIIGGYKNCTKYCTYDGTSWVTETNLPYAVMDSGCVPTGRFINILGCDPNTTSTKTKSHLLLGSTGQIHTKLPKGAKIYGNVFPYENCKTIEKSNNLIAAENGTVKMVSSSVDQETIYVCIDSLSEEEIGNIL